MRAWVLIILWLCHASYATELNIIAKPIQFDEKRQELTRIYRAQHYAIDREDIVIQPQIIVIHWTALPTLARSFNFFDPVTLHTRPDIAQGGELNVSAHYLIDRDGSIYQLMPDNWFARHVIGLNNSAIGIENVGGVGNQADLTPAQLQANILLVEFLVTKYPSIHYLIGHHEYLNFVDTPLWLEQNPHYRTQKSDPGNQFMNDLRQALKHLPHIAKPPENADHFSDEHAGEGGLSRERDGISPP